MEKKSKKNIIIGITSLLLVTLILLGLTYAYFQTRIVGNDADTSMSVTSKNLEIVYSDDSAAIVASEIEPGYTVTKTFTVTNTGDDSVKYAVILDKVYNEFARTSDWIYTVTCSSTIGECGGVTDKEFPMGGGSKGAGLGDGIVVVNTIESKAVQTYEFRLTYKNLSDVDQSEDMGKTLEGRLNIADYSIMNSYTDNTESFAYQLINNAINVSDSENALGYAKYTATPLTELASGKSGSYYEESKFGTEVQTFNVTDKSLYWTYGTEYTFNKNSGYTITDAKTGTYDEMLAALSSGNVYLTDTSESGNTSATDLLRGYSNMEKLYKITAATDTSVSIVTKTVVEQTFNESTISVIEEETGISYYYRGNVTNNYVNFAEMCWRVVRITSDGGIKLILEDYDDDCAPSDGNYYIPSGKSANGENHVANGVTYGWGETASAFNSKTWRYINYLSESDGSKYNNLTASFKAFQTGKLANYTSKLKVGNWCVDDTAYTDKVGDAANLLSSTELLTIKNGSNTATTEDYNNLATNLFYNSYVRLRGREERSVQLNCEGTFYNQFADGTDMYVGTLTADEIVLAGAKSSSANSNYYLVNGQSGWWWGLSPWSWTKGSYSDYVISVGTDGTMYSHMLTNHGYARPVVVLDNDKVTITGSGTKANPYVVS